MEVRDSEDRLDDRAAADPQDYHSDEQTKSGGRFFHQIWAEAPRFHIRGCTWTQYPLLPLKLVSSAEVRPVFCW